MSRSQRRDDRGRYAGHTKGAPAIALNVMDCLALNENEPISAESEIRFAQMAVAVAQRDVREARSRLSGMPSINLSRAGRREREAAEVELLMLEGEQRRALNRLAIATGTISHRRTGPQHPVPPVLGRRGHREIAASSRAAVPSLSGFIVPEPRRGADDAIRAVVRQRG